jgi:hypothetical protein
MNETTISFSNDADFNAAIKFNGDLALPADNEDDEPYYALGTSVR